MLWFHLPIPDKHSSEIGTSLVRSCARRLKVTVVTGDVRQMHRSPENAAALFQVASQFNLLEMVSPATTPEHGVTRYQFDRTQGPACAIAAKAHRRLILG
jgi:hypothetical protein